ncbi:Acyl-protein synthetase, LuxE [Flavobacteriaceae bacterium MAR_2010_188]|nr:Acyl-protein synthetase, LuxE [Flavobacteriaceae bacterium MAR_2010_188]
MIKTDEIFNISNDDEFENCALQVFQHQFENNQVYRSFCDLLLKHPSDIKTIEEIPFLPIQFFKSHEVIERNRNAEKTFYSSGTTLSGRSKHLVSDLSVYEESFRKGFEHYYGNINDYTILGLLPSYLEQGDSSLIYMVDDLIKNSKKPESGFFLNDFSMLSENIQSLEKSGEKYILIGVTYALLDLVETHQFKMKRGIVMETGGMKGRRKEMVREELHQQLMQGFGVNSIHSEYGMTELLSQAYSKGNGIFDCPPWMKIISRSVQDPLTILESTKTGGINIIDLANVNSCSFIATQDLGRVNEDESFEIIGRFDSADIRGCNLMIL